MVLSPANKSTTVGKSDTESTVLMVILLAILTATATLVLYYLVAGLQENNTVITENVVIDEADESAYVSPEITEVEPEKIDFQPVVDEWVNLVGGNKSVLIYDLDRDEIVGSHNTTKRYNTASLYKLFVYMRGIAD